MLFGSSVELYVYILHEYSMKKSLEAKVEIKNLCICTKHLHTDFCLCVYKFFKLYSCKMET